MSRQHEEGPQLDEEGLREAIALETELDMPPAHPPHGTIMVDADGTAWQYGPPQRWWSASNYGSVAAGRFSRLDGPYRLVWSP